MSKRLQQRCEIVLLADEGLTDLEIALKLGTHRQSAARWRQRFLQEGISTLERDVPGRGRKPQISEEIRTEILRLTKEGTLGPDGQPWHLQTLAEKFGISPSSVSLIWRANGIFWGRR